MASLLSYSARSGAERAGELHAVALLRQLQSATRSLPPREIDVARHGTDLQLERCLRVTAPSATLMKYGCLPSSTPPSRSCAGRIGDLGKLGTRTAQLFDNGPAQV
jgi:hypothetical protein